MTTSPPPVSYDPIQGWAGLTDHRRARIEVPAGSGSEPLAGLLADSGVKLLQPVVAPLRVDLLRFDAFVIARIVGPESSAPEVAHRIGLLWERSRPASRRRCLFALSPGGGLELDGPAPHRVTDDGDVAVVFPGTHPVRISARRPLDVVLFSFEEDEILPLELNPRSTVLTSSACAVLRAVHAYLQTVLQGSTDARYEQTAALRALTGEMARALTRTAHPAPASQRALDLAAEILDAEHANPELTPDRIAVRLGVSRSTLARAFASRGTTLADELRHRRTRTAHRLLVADPTLPTRALAMRSGFRSVSSLERAVLAVLGRPLSDLRSHHG